MFYMTFASTKYMTFKKKMYLNILCTFSEAILCNNLKKMSNNESSCLFVEDYMIMMKMMMWKMMKKSRQHAILFY